VPWFGRRWSKNLVDDESLSAFPIENKPACKPVAGVSLPWSQFSARARDVKDDRMFVRRIGNVDIHPISGNLLVRLRFRIVRGWWLSRAGPYGIDPLHVLESSERIISCCGKVEDTAGSDVTAFNSLLKNLDLSKGL
jgi:hypothetical protein